VIKDTHGQDVTVVRSGHRGVVDIPEVVAEVTGRTLAPVASRAYCVCEQRRSTSHRCAG
jgi:hypothetical protein